MFEEVIFTNVREIILMCGLFSWVIGTTYETAAGGLVYVRLHDYPVTAANCENVNIPAGRRNVQTGLPFLPETKEKWVSSSDVICLLFPITGK